ncbi:uncharacterized protein BDV17DRAFT_288245 [Aspergillus undulatus]|uniref:uncharacterized protein n=1 Tax=Aspergillus undulatus TaxID=1810928 RepID=UPI003CCD9323
MVSPAFGFSVGDFITGTKLLIDLFNAFKEAGGASSKYTAEVSFLNSLNATLGHLETYAGNNSQNDLSQSVNDLIKVMRGPLDIFKEFLDKYASSLSESSTKSALGKAPRTVRYTVKDISGKVQGLRTQIEQPLQAVNTLLSLRIITLLEKLPDNLLNPTHCAQLVEAIRLADIPAELDKQIRALQHDAATHKIQQDEHLQTVKALRTELGEKITKLQATLNSIKDEEASAPDSFSQSEASRTGVNVDIDKLSTALQSGTDKLSETIKEHGKMIIALKCFLDDKASASANIAVTNPKSASHLSPVNHNHDEDDGADDRGNEQKKHPLGFSWPSATLPAAHLALTLLSGVASTVAAVSVNRASRPPPVPRPLPNLYDEVGATEIVANVQGPAVPSEVPFPQQITGEAGPIPKPESSTTVSKKDEGNPTVSQPDKPDAPTGAPTTAFQSATTTTTTTATATPPAPTVLSSRQCPSGDVRKERVSQWLDDWRRPTSALAVSSGGLGNGLGGGVERRIASGFGGGGGGGGGGNRMSKLSTSPPSAGAGGQGGRSGGSNGSGRAGGSVDTSSDSPDGSDSSDYDPSDDDDPSEDQPSDDGPSDDDPSDDSPGYGYSSYDSDSS